MEFVASEFIRERKKGNACIREHLEKFVNGYVNGEIPDYQMAAWMMAICFKPLSSAETIWLTEAMANSGRRLRFKNSADKHSTGGVGDKATLILAPIVAAAGVNTPLMAGRGLGHTAGTLDKLEAISGMNVRLSVEKFEQQIASMGLAITGQTQEICPADRKMYSLRDVTGTVDSIPLICGSIMSKKIAGGCEALVLDVKFGSGAFMKSFEQAEELASRLMEIGRGAGIKISALLTNMNEPLGRMIGHASEIRESIQILKGEKSQAEGKSLDDIEELSLELAAHMIFLKGRTKTLPEAQKLAREILVSGKAYEKFCQFVAAQNGDLSKPLPVAKNEFVLKAEASGYFQFRDVEKLGLGCIVLGAGRVKTTDTIDLAAGIENFVKDGQPIKKGQTIFRIFANGEEKIEKALDIFKLSFAIVDKQPPKIPLVAKVLT